MSTYEVTVPVTIVVEDKGQLRVTDVRFDEWGGFFSDAEEAAGVWHVDEEGWGHEDQEAIYQLARSYVRSRVEGKA